MEQPNRIKIPWSIPNLQKEDLEEAKKVLDSGWYTMGKKVEELERGMASYTGRKYAIAVNNGTSAVELMLRARGITQGHEVIVPAMTYIATAATVNMVGAKPVFVDVDDKMTINPKKIPEAITKNTKAVIAVDLTGSPCDYNELEKVCKKNNIDLLVDGAQSLGSYFKEKSCLSYGLISSTSFHAAKILTTIEGGMIFTDDENINERIKTIRNQGESKKKYVHEILGGNYRMTDFTAALAINQLKRLDNTLKDRARIVNLYKNLLKGYVEFNEPRKESKSGNFIFSIISENRLELVRYLKEQGIETREIFPRTLPKQPAYRIKGRFPFAEWFCEKNLSLPLFYGLKDNGIKYICDAVKRASNSKKEDRISLRPMTALDCRGVAKIHKREFSSQDFLPSLGIETLAVIYRGMLKKDKNFGFVAEKNNHLVGFVTATEEASSLFKDVIKKEFIAFSYYLLSSLAKNPLLISKMIQTLNYSQKSESDTKAELISIAVKRKHQGLGIGEQLGEAFVREMERRGKNKIKVTVNASNEAANKFYKKIGFLYSKSFKIYDKKMNLYTLQI